MRYNNCIKCNVKKNKAASTTWVGNTILSCTNTNGHKKIGIKGKFIVQVSKKVSNNILKLSAADDMA